MDASIEGEDKVLATAQRIVRSLHSTSDTDDMLSIFSALGHCLSTLSSFVSSDDASLSPGLEAGPTCTYDPRFGATNRILNGTDSGSFSKGYLAAVDKVIE